MKKLIGIVFLGVVLGLMFSPLVGAQVTIKVAHFYDPATGPAHVANMQWLEKVKSVFEEENPGIKVEFEWIKWDELDLKALRDYRAGISHDVIYSSPQYYGLHQVAGDLLDISNFVSQWSDDFLADISWSPVWGSAFPWGVPLGIHTRSVVYRRDMYEEAGLDPDKTPDNLDELVEYSKKLTQDTDGDGVTDIYGLGMYFGPSRATIELYFAPYLWHFDGELWDPETKKATFASEAGISAAQFLFDLISTHKVTPEWSISGIYDDVIMMSFLNEKLAQAEGWGSYWIGPLEEKGWVEGVFPPTPEGKATIADVYPTPTKYRAQFTNSWNVSIHALSEHPAESWKFIETMIRPELLIDYPDAGLPALLSLWERPEFKTPFYQKWLEAARSGRPMPLTAHYGDLADTVAACLQEIFATKAPIAETLKKFEDEYNSKFAGE